jgi:putative restriction endonuclease
MSDINQAERARLAWNVLSGVAASRTTTTYGRLGANISIHHRAVRYVLELIQDYCLSARLPPLTILVVNSSGRPGNGFIAHDLDDFEHGLEIVWAHDWSTENNPFDFAAAGTSYNQLVEQLVDAPEESKDVYVRVKSRGIRQFLFRDAVRRAYNWKCAFTGINYKEALEACHIVPWSQASLAERLDVRNGLLLNSFHHRLFDSKYITITEDYKIKYCNPKGTERNHSPIERSLTIELHGKSIVIPKLSIHRPYADYINRHNSLLDG